jgi:hypothetical protein
MAQMNYPGNDFFNDPKWPDKTDNEIFTAIYTKLRIRLSKDASFSQSYNRSLSHMLNPSLTHGQLVLYVNGLIRNGI